MERIKVAVSPFYGGEDWTDELTRITFEKNARGLNVYSIPADLDLTGIRKAIRLNALILVEGNIGEFNEVKDIVIETPAKVEEPKEEVKKEIEEEIKVEEPKEVPAADVKISVAEEAPKKKQPAKKKTK